MLRLVRPEITRLVPEAGPDRIGVTFAMGPTRITVGERGLNPGDATGDALADAVALRDAGATSVSSTVTDAQTGLPAKADVEAPQTRLVALAAVARGRQRPVDLRGGDAWYRSNEVPDPAARTRLWDRGRRGSGPATSAVEPVRSRAYPMSRS